MRERCLCGALDCPSCGPAQGWHVHNATCWGEDGFAECGQMSYDDHEADDDVTRCLYCEARCDEDVCPSCREQMEVEDRDPAVEEE